MPAFHSSSCRRQAMQRWRKLPMTEPLMLLLSRPAILPHMIQNSTQAGSIQSGRVFGNTNAAKPCARLGIIDHR